MEKSKQRELFLDTVNHRSHSEFLYYFDTTPDLFERLSTEIKLGDGEQLSERFGLFHPENLSPRDSYNGDPMLQPDFMAYYSDIDVPPEAYLDGNGVLHIPGSMYHFTHYIAPLRGERTLKEIERFPFRMMSEGTERGMAEDAWEARQQGRVTQCWIGHIYENAWQVRGYEDFLADFSLAPENCEYILQRFADHNLAFAVAAARAGVDMIRTGDDVAGQNGMIFGAERWRRVLKPLWQRIYAEAKRIKPDIKIWYHSDGDITEIIGDLIDIGVDILNPLQPECMDVAALKRKFGSHLVFDGAIGTQSVMPFGSPEDVRRTVLKAKRELGQDGALILSPTHVLEPEVPIANILAFVEACREAG
jgi:uroporphyrinogen decarboxylase